MVSLAKDDAVPSYEERMERWCNMFAFFRAELGMSKEEVLGCTYQELTAYRRAWENKVERQSNIVASCLSEVVNVLLVVNGYTGKLTTPEDYLGGGDKAPKQAAMNDEQIMTVLKTFHRMVGGRVIGPGGETLG